jgi:ATP-dependent Clp protease ATP-binding subunit ClpA
MFERYTEQARRVIFFARWAATRAQAQEITTLHLLYGMTFDRFSRSAEIISRFENIKEVQKRLNIPLNPVSNEQILLRSDIALESNAKCVLKNAFDEAEKNGQYWIAPDTLLCALLSFDNDATVVLKSIHLDYKAASELSKTNPRSFSGRCAQLQYYWKRFHWFLKTHPLILWPILAIIVGVLVVLLIRLINS